MNDATQFFNTSGSAGYEIARSLRFNSADSAYLNRTPASAGNRKTWTLTAWVKRGTVTGSQDLFWGGLDSGTTASILELQSSGSLRFLSRVGGVDDCDVYTDALYRDASAWYHFVVSIDTTQVVAGNRIRIYVNNILQSYTGTSPSQNTDLVINGAYDHTIGVLQTIRYFNGYLADIHFIDGQALDPSSFGEFDDNGVWQPKAYSGSYGTNGFHLPFSNNSTAAALGTDTSGNGNTWTVNNFSVAAGAGNDSLVDSPTNYGTDTGAGGEVRGNYATLNPIRTAGNGTLSNGNLEQQTPTNGNGFRAGTIGVSSGKWYWEATFLAGEYPVIGLVTSADPDGPGTIIGHNSTDWGYIAHTGNKIHNAVNSAYGNSFAVNDVVGVAFDADNGTLTFYKNGVSQGTAFTGITGAGPYFPAMSDFNVGTSATVGFNFGQRPFAYTAPSGFKALCTTNLPEPAIVKSSTAMDVALWTGNGTTQTISGLNFSPDWVWIKQRDGGSSHRLHDAVRGAGWNLNSNTTSPEGDETAIFTQFTSDGFTLATGAGAYNNAGRTYVAWTWDAGSSTVTNTDGSITSQVRANASAGFSIVTYTGTGANATVGHGLGVAPRFIILKSRSNTLFWYVYAAALNSPSQYLLLNATDSAGSASVVWNNTAPTSTTFSIGTDTGPNTSGATYVAYCFAAVDGYSSFGSYTGNGSTDGPFVYTGFRPRWVLLKSTTIGTEPWMLQDSKRDPYNPSDSSLFPNWTNNESSGSPRNIDFLSNGFKLRTGDTGHNGSNAGYIYAAFAEHPFQTSRAR